MKPIYLALIVGAIFTMGYLSAAFFILDKVETEVNKEAEYFRGFNDGVCTAVTQLTKYKNCNINDSDTNS
jgi:hypothetical protein